MIMMVKRAGEREKKKTFFSLPPPSLGSTTREGRGGREKGGMEMTVRPTLFETETLGRRSRSVCPPRAAQ